ncbi:hypothetical protein ASG23_13280 [Cellulomonas sp. Leaf395]|nr:hypothetical protein ASG23_13280 [Cellulomonas sp. Leaf395]
MSINGKLFMWVLAVVRASGVIPLLEAVLKPDPRLGGAPRRFGLDVWLAAFVVAVMSGMGAYETRALQVLTEDLPRSLQVALGVRRERAGSDEDADIITIRQIREPLARLAKNLNQSDPALPAAVREHRRRTLQKLASTMASGTVPELFGFLGVWALDHTPLPAWARPWAKYKDNDGNDRIVSADQEARWGHATPTFQTGNNQWVFGYRANTYTIVGDDVPAFIEAVEVRPANVGGAEPSVRLGQWLANHPTNVENTFTKIYADREYPHSLPENWHHPLRALGAELVFDINELDMGIEHYRGMMFINGYPFCPGLPVHLQVVNRPDRLTQGERPGDDDPDAQAMWDNVRKQHEELRSLTEARRPYELVRLSGNGAGKERFMCQALKHHAACPLRAFTMQYPDVDKLTIVEPPPAHLRVEEGICFRKSITVYDDVSPKTRQRHPWLSAPWLKDYRNRTTVERSYASVKSSANERVSRGWIQLHGLVNVTFMFAVSAMSQNLRLAIKYIADHPDIADPCVILRGPAAFFGHEELNEAGEMELYDKAGAIALYNKLVNPDPDPTA